MRKLSIVLCYFGDGEHVIHDADETSIYSTERVNAFIEWVKQKQDPVTVITGKIYPSFKRSPEKIEILTKLVELYDHYELDSNPLITLSSPCFSNAEINRLMDSIEAMRVQNRALRYMAEEIRKEIDQEILKQVCQSA